MKTTTTASKPASNAGGGAKEYERLLSVAQAAQSAADRAVADLAAVKRTLAEAPRVTQLRREELERAQQALERAEVELEQAREQLAGRQAEAARLIEAAAEAQRALAQALINQDVMPDSAMAEMVQSRRSAAPAVPLANPVSSGASPSFDATLGSNARRYTPSMHPADLHAEVVEYLVDRDALCPSCGHSLRGIDSAKCPGCRLQLSVQILKSVRPHWVTATPIIWLVRVLAVVAMGLSGYLAVVRFKPFGCGLGSDCHAAFQSSWAKLAGIPLGALGVPIFLGILLCTGFINIGLPDRLRRRAWSTLSVLSMIAGLAGLWFIIVQTVIIQRLCPHCLVVNAFGVIIAAIVLFLAPLGKPEKLPERAAGPIVIPGSRGGVFLIAALSVVGAIAGTQVANRKPLPEVRAPEPPPEDGLLMKPLDIEVEEKKPKPAPRPPEPAKELPPPVFEYVPPKEKTGEKSSIGNPASPQPSTPQPTPPKPEDEKSKLKLDLKSDSDKGAADEPGKDPADSSAEKKKDGEKDAPIFDFAPTIDLKK